MAANTTGEPLQEQQQFTDGDTVELTFEPVPVASSEMAKQKKLRLYIAAALIGFGVISVTVILFCQIKLTSFPTYQHVIVVDVKNDVVEAALVRRFNPALRANIKEADSIDSSIVAVCGDQGNDRQEMIESCVVQLEKSIPEKRMASLLFLVTGRPVLRQWANCNVTDEIKQVTEIALEIANKFPPTRIKLADNGDFGTRLVMAEDQAVGAYIGANGRHLGTNSVGVVGIDTKSAYLGQRHVSTDAVDSINLPIFKDNVAGVNVESYVESFYCFGIDEIWKIYLQSLLGYVPTTRSAFDPCAPAQTIFTISWDEIWKSTCSQSILKTQHSPGQCPNDLNNFNQVAKVDFTGSNNPKECQTRIKNLLLGVKDGKYFSGSQLPSNFSGEYLLFDGTGSIARAVEFAFKYREGPEGKDETVLNGRDLFLADISTAVGDFCSKSMDPKTLRKFFNINSTSEEIDGDGRNSDLALMRTCFNAMYSVELLTSIGISTNTPNAYTIPPNHIVFAQPPDSGVVASDKVGGKLPLTDDHLSPDGKHDGIHHSGHRTGEWMAGYLETTSGIDGDYSKVHPFSRTAFVIVLILLGSIMVAGVVLIAMVAVNQDKQEQQGQQQHDNNGDEEQAKGGVAAAAAAAAGQEGAETKANE